MAVRIRPPNPADAASLARVHVDSWRSTYAGIIPDEYLADLSYQDRESFWDQVLASERPAVSNFLVETEQGEVIGMAAGGPERSGNEIYLGELYLVYLLEAFQRKGLGRRMVSAVASRLLDDGIGSMLVGVLRDNRIGCRFYESLGGELIDQRVVSIGGADLEEVFYGWTDVRALVIDRQ